MQSLADEVDKLTSSFDSGISKLEAGNSEKTPDAKTLFGKTKGVGYQIAGSEKANKATTIDQYARKKGQK